VAVAGSLVGGASGTPGRATWLALAVGGAVVLVLGEVARRPRGRR
jgi:hypothetical protein